MSQIGAGLVAALEDLDLIALSSQLPGCCQSAGPEPTTATDFPFGSAAVTPRTGGCFVVPVGGESLDQSDRHRTFELGAGALPFTGGVAGAPEGADQWGGVEHQLDALRTCRYAPATRSRGP